MHKFHMFFAALVLAAPWSANALQVFACEPEWAALAHEVGGAHVETFSATTARQDAHHIRAKPSLIAAMRRADLVVCTGASLEIGWLPVLIQKGGSANTQPGSPGFLSAADVVALLEKPVSVDRSQGDVHPDGNPHLQLNPHNIARVGQALTARLIALDPNHASDYRAQGDAFQMKWRQAIAGWEKAGEGLRGTPVITHHPAFVYLLQWLGMQAVGTLEPKPGIPPTAAHLEELLAQQKSYPAKLIIRAPYEPDDASRWLSKKTGVPYLVLPYTVGGDEKSSDLYALFDRTLALLNGAAHGGR